MFNTNWLPYEYKIFPLETFLKIYTNAIYGEKIIIDN